MCVAGEKVLMFFFPPKNYEMLLGLGGGAGAWWGILNKKRKRPRKARRWLREGKVPCALNQEFFFWFTSIWVLRDPSRLKYRLLQHLVYQEAMCEGSSGNGLLYAAKADTGKDYFTQVEIPLRSIRSEEGPHYRLGAKRERESCHLTSDNQLFFHELGILRDSYLGCTA